MKLYLIAALFLATLVIVPCLAEEEIGNGATANEPPGEARRVEDEIDEEFQDGDEKEKRGYPQLSYHSCRVLKRYGYCRHSTLSRFCLRVCLPAQCFRHRVINDITRRKSRPRGNLLLCDNRISQGWYRFVGNTGTYIPNRCVPSNRCGTHAAGWVVGNYPTVSGQTVTRQVCFNWANNCCYNAKWWKIHIQITNCGGYFVFYLRRPRACSYRYCGNR